MLRWMVLAIVGLVSGCSEFVGPRAFSSLPPRRAVSSPTRGVDVHVQATLDLDCKYSFGSAKGALSSKCWNYPCVDLWVADAAKHEPVAKFRVECIRLDGGVSQEQLDFDARRLLRSRIVWSQDGNFVAVRGPGIDDLAAWRVARIEPDWAKTVASGFFDGGGAAEPTFLPAMRTSYENGLYERASEYAIVAVETTLSRHPSVDDVVALTVPAPLGSCCEKDIAFVTLEPDQPPVTSTELAAYAEHELRWSDSPSVVVIHDVALPSKNDAGALYRLLARAITYLPEVAAAPWERKTP